jgi:hypothetical protein
LSAKIDGMPEVTIQDLNELRALHRMLFTRKFDGPTDEFFASPYIANIQRRVLGAPQATEGSTWGEWADAGSHRREVELVKAYLSQAGDWWGSLPDDQRREQVLDLLSPLSVPPDLLDELARI